MSGKKKRFQPGKLSVTKQSPIKRTVKQTLERRGGSYGYKSGTDLDHCGNNDVIDDINPYREKGINIISIAIDAPQDVISSLSGKIGRLRGVSAKTAYSNVITKAEDRK